MEQNYILMLPSWFPNKEEPTAGNFIKSHIEAIGSQRRVVVVYIKFVDRKIFYADEEVQEGNILYIIKYVVKPNTGITKFFIYYQFCLQLMARLGKPSCIHVHVAWPAGLVAWMLKKLKNIPYVISEHSSRYLSESHAKPHWGEKIIYKNAAGVSAVSEHLAACIQSYMKGKEKPAVIPNLIDDEIYQLQLPQEKEKYFIHISNFAPVKQSIKIVEAFIQAAAFLDGYKLYLYGEDGEEKEQCTRLALDHGLLYKSIFIEGVIPKLEVAEKLSKATALVSYSLYETQGMTVYEAVAVHCPVICRSIPSFAHLVLADRGIQVETDEELTQAMIHITQRKFYTDTSVKQLRYDQKYISSLFEDFYITALG